MSRRYDRRSTRPLEDLPSLFDQEEEGDEKDHIFGIDPEAAPPPTGADEFALDEVYTRPRRALRFISFGSGSSGNCAYIGTPECGLLIDAGVDNNFVTAELARNGIDIKTIRGILLTHDHADHVRYSYALVRRNPHMRLYATNRTIDGMLRRHNISRRIKDYHSAVFKEHEYRFGEMTVTPFETSHDGSDNVGYHVALSDGCTFVVATDMGVITPRADHYMRLANALMIESNYDEQMLTAGRYPEYLKARIRGERGHMDNAVTARYLTDTYRPTLRHIFLCHLSDDNNTPETALATVLNSLRDINIQPARSAAEVENGTVWVSGLPRYKSSDLFIL